MASYTIKSLKLGVNKMTITSSGNVSIGAGFQPKQKLYVTHPFDALNEIKEVPQKEVTDTMVDIYLGK